MVVNSSGSVVDIHVDVDVDVDVDSVVDEVVDGVVESHGFDVASDRLREVCVSEVVIVGARRVLYKLPWFLWYVEHYLQNYA